MNQINSDLIKSPTRKLVLSGVLSALGVVLSTFYIPFGAAKCFPVQHLINVMSAVLLGPFYAVLNAFVISVIRNITGLGSPLAFPGSMIGALLAGLMYKQFKNYRIACLGEVIGTGVIGAIVAAPFAILILGKEVGLFFFIIPFVISSFVGSGIALIIFEATSLISVLRKNSGADL